LVVGPERHSGVWLRRARVCALFVALTAVMTWPSVLHLGTHSVEHQDIFFNVWRMEWVRHALLTSPRDLFNGNQFYPERGVLAYSDAMMVESLIALPLLSAGLPPMLVHNLLLLGVIAASGIGMFVLARYLWGNTPAAIVAGLIFAFAPYRFSHFMHMELQWAVWMPWALWAMQRTLDTGTLRYGLLTGLFMALQLTSSIYYGLFLAVILAAIAAIQAIATGRRALRAVGALAAGAAVLAATAWVYSGPYRQASARVGLRSVEEMRNFSAVPSSYLRVPEANWLHGRWRAGSEEVGLYPGIVPVALGLIALLAMRPTRTTLAYGTGLALAVDFSLGVNGLLYPHLQYYVPIFKGLRAPSRASILFLLCLAVLAARASAAILARVPASRQTLCATAIAALILVEYWSAPMRLISYPRRARLYEVLATLPDGNVLEVPLPRLDSLPFQDARYLYSSTLHWKKLVNGYSGYYPRTYIERLIRLRAFPSASAINQMRFDKVRYVVVHEDRYVDPAEGVRTVEALVRLGAKPLGRMDDGWYPATLIDMQPVTGAGQDHESAVRGP
jgi:hypothetical protein